MNQTKKIYCLPIIRENKGQILKILSDNINDYEYFEIWLDYIKGINENFIDTLLTKFEKKLIFVFRRQNLDKLVVDMNTRLKLLTKLSNASAMIDLDIFDQEFELNHIQQKNLHPNIITSYHNYNKTPSNAKIKKIINLMKTYQPNIFKIATKCNSEEDGLRLLRILLELRRQEIRYIILGMGKKGDITRIFGPIWGNEIIFSPKNTKDSSALGQLTKNHLKKIYKGLE